MAKKSIFISYDYDNDRAYKNLLLAWDKNSDFDFGFNDQSADVSIDSTDASVIKRAISAKINGSAVTGGTCSTSLERKEGLPFSANLSNLSAVFPI